MPENPPLDRASDAMTVMDNDREPAIDVDVYARMPKILYKEHHIMGGEGANTMDTKLILR